MQSTDRPSSEIDEADIPAGCKACGARQFGICSALKASQLAHFSTVTRRRKIAHGETISFEDDEVVDYANIVAGAVKLTKLLSDGRQQIVGLQFAPEFIGKPFSEKVSISVEAATDVEICVFPKAELESMLKQQPDFEHRLLEQTLVQLDDARAWMVTLGRKTAQEKVASFLLLLADHIGKPAHSEFMLPLKRADIADFLGLTLETVSRQMTKLRKMGAIDIRKNLDVTVHDTDRLIAISGGD
ncbi:MAG: Crp/Fnr family transcriptional regulator [Pseudomonadota bacterium]